MSIHVRARQVQTRMHATMRACTCTTGSVTRTRHAKCHAHARTQAYTCVAVYAWADTHITRSIRVSLCLHMQQNSNTFKHTIAQTYMSLCSHTHSAQCTMQALVRTHMPCTRTHAGNGGHHPHFHAQACTCSLSDW